jgi:hypothetical protein
MKQYLKQHLSNALLFWFALTWAITFAYMLTTKEHSITLWDGNTLILSIELATATAAAVWAVIRLARWHNA